MQPCEKNLEVFAFLLISFLITLLASCSFSFSNQDKNEPEKKLGLFNDTHMKNKPCETGEPFMVRSRCVSINFQMLIMEGSSVEAKSAISKTVQLNLFDNVSLTAVRDHLEFRKTNDFSWMGHIKGIESSEVILVLKDQVMVGNITTPDARYQVRYGKNSTHVVSEVDQAAFPQELEPIPVK